MSGTEYCYWHYKARERSGDQQPPKRSEKSIINFPLLEDASAIQVAIQEVLIALAHGRIDAFRAKALLYGLQLAGSNVRRLEHLRLTRNKVVGCLFWADGICNHPDPEMRSNGECSTCEIREYILEEVKKDGGANLLAQCGRSLARKP